MEIPTTGVHHITLIGSNRQDTIDFYQGILGMPLVFEQPNLDVPEETHLYFDAGDGNLITFFVRLPGVDSTTALRAARAKRFLSITSPTRSPAKPLTAPRRGWRSSVSPTPAALTVGLWIPSISAIRMASCWNWPPTPLPHLRAFRGVPSSSWRIASA